MLSEAALAIALPRVMEPREVKAGRQGNTLWFINTCVHLLNYAFLRVKAVTSNAPTWLGAAGELADLETLPEKSTMPATILTAEEFKKRFGPIGTTISTVSPYENARRSLIRGLARETDPAKRAELEKAIKDQEALIRHLGIHC